MKKQRFFAVIIIIIITSLNGYNYFIRSTEKSCEWDKTFVRLRDNRNVTDEITFHNPFLGKKIIYVETLENWSGNERRFDYEEIKIGEVIQTPKWMQSIGLKKSIYRFWDKGCYNVKNVEIKNSTFLQVLLVTLIRLADIFVICFLIFFLWKRKQQ